MLTSACNYYDGVTQQEAEAFYSAMKDPKDETPVSYGLNSRLVKENGKIQEKSVERWGLVRRGYREDCILAEESGRRGREP